MRILKYTAIFVLMIGLAITGVFLSSRGERAYCVPQTHVSEGRPEGYELIDLSEFRVWATRDWTRDSFNAFSLPKNWAFWFKNNPRVGTMDDGAFLRSPGCDADGQFNYMRAFDREFVQVVKLRAFNRKADAEGLVRESVVEKSHIVQFDLGRDIAILTNPAGERFIEISRSMNRDNDTPTVPAGWTLVKRTLSQPLEIKLVGEVRVLRLDNEDSFQGPLSEDASFLASGHAWIADDQHLAN